MMRSMYSGVSGLKNHQTRMDVIGNNIANVNTAGYKKSRVVFKDTFYQATRGASRPTDEKGGINPMAVGLGMTIASIDQIHTPSPTTTTNKTTDMAVNGDGYFVLSPGKTSKNYSYTRSGAFDFDVEGNLVSSANGYNVQGWIADSTSWKIVADPNNTTPINIKGFKEIGASTTTSMTLSGNLKATQAVGVVPATPADQAIISNWTDSITFPCDVYDSEGIKVPVNIMLTKSGTDAWQARYFVYRYNADGSVQKDALGNPLVLTPPTVINFTAPGNPLAIPAVPALANAPFPGFTADGIVNKDYLDTDGKFLSDNITIPGVGDRKDITLKVDFAKMTQWDIKSTSRAESQNGYAPGSMTGFSISTTGIISGAYSNGVVKDLAQVALATFQNPGGLQQAGGTLFEKTVNSGEQMIGAPGDGGKGTVIPGSLEMSNVDLSEEFTDMIVTQRGFQANSRIITTSDEMLQELVNLKR